MSGEKPYTPSTTMVRLAYIASTKDDDGPDWTREEAKAEFTRWLDGEKAKVLDGARAELRDAYKRGPGNNLQGRVETWRKGVSRAHRIVQDYQRGLGGGAS